VFAEKFCSTTSSPAASQPSQVESLNRHLNHTKIQILIWYYDNMPSTQFVWDDKKNDANLEKHHVSFQVAQGAFMDLQRVIARDLTHSEIEERFYCFGKVDGGVLTVRLTYRGKQIRIFGAGYWRKGKQIYEKENNLHE
jgi:uncharacterized protein